MLSIWFYVFKPYYSNFVFFKLRVKELGTDNLLVFTPNSGRYILPEETQFVLFVIDSLQLKDYKLYKSFGVNSEVFQRINESAWPLINDSNSTNLFGYSNELLELPNIKIKSEYKKLAYGSTY